MSWCILQSSGLGIRILYSSFQSIYRDFLPKGTHYTRLSMQFRCPLLRRCDMVNRFTEIWEIDSIPLSHTRCSYATVSTQHPNGPLDSFLLWWCWCWFSVLGFFFVLWEFCLSGFFVCLLWVFFPEPVVSQVHSPIFRLEETITSLTSKAFSLSI